MLSLFKKCTDRHAMLLLCYSARFLNGAFVYARNNKVSSLSTCSQLEADFFNRLLVVGVGGILSTYSRSIENSSFTAATLPRLSSRYH